MKSPNNSLCEKTLKIVSYLTLTAASALLVCTSTAASDTDAAAKVVAARFFAQPIEWAGTKPPPEAESEALLEDMNAFKTSGPLTGFACLEKFLDEYPNSAWSPSLNVYLAEYYRAHGRYSLALKHWETAWHETKGQNDFVSMNLAVRTIAGWTRLLATLGERDKLNVLFKEIDALNLPYGVCGTEIQETREALGVMNHRPGVSYRCGSFALGHLAAALHLDPDATRRLYEIDSPDGGFHMDQLLRLAKTNGMELEAVRRPDGAPLVVPCVVHWRLNHYAAIVQEKNGRYLVEDPTFGNHLWMDGDAITEEASGEYIVPWAKAPANWQQLTEAECAKIYGKGDGDSFDDPQDNGPPECDDSSDGEQDEGDSGCEPPASNDGSTNSSGPPPPPCPSCVGMPQWYVSEPYETLWLEDVPLLYRQSDGSWMKLRLTYKSTGIAPPTGTTTYNFGADWTCNWIGLIQANGDDVVTNYLSSGGLEGFNVDGTPDYKTGRTLMIYSSSPPAGGSPGGSPPSGSGVTGMVLQTPRGAQNVYGYQTQFYDYGQQTNFLLTQRVDRYGRVLQQMNYISDGQVLSVVDMDGKTNSIIWGGGLGFYITDVTNPYAMSAHFRYLQQQFTSAFLLTNITDAQGLSTKFAYDSNDRITNMITPYGTNSFQYYSGYDASSNVERALLITEPTGDHQLYVYRDNSPDSIPYPGDGYTSLRMSFHWNRSQYVEIASDWQTYGFEMPRSDYQKASIKHFLHEPPGSTPIVSDTLDSSADPYDLNLGTRPNCLTYQYYGESPPYIGTLKRVTSESVNNQLAVTIGLNSLGRPTNFVYYSTSGAQASYTNFFDSTGMILQSESGPHGELTRGYGYTTGIDGINNLLVSVTNAVGDVINYTHDPASLKLTSVTFPGGMIRTNIYFSSGPYQGFLQQQIDIGFRTNCFCYTNGNVSKEVDALGLCTRYTYDNLNRLISTTYPDGTTVSNVYNRLDLVATKDRLNQWTYYGYNSLRQLIAYTNVDGQVTTYGYCSCGSPDYITNWNGNTSLITAFTYDTVGRLSTATYPDGYNLTYTYDAYNRPYSILDGAEYNLELGYSMYGTINQLSNAVLGAQTLLTQQFDEYGRLTNSVDRNGVTTDLSYDLLSRLATRQNFGSDGKYTGQETFQYTSLGLTNYTDQLGHQTIYVYDAAGRVLYETNANNEVLQFAYNPADELLTLIDGKDQTTTWNYDQFGMVTNKIDDAGNTNFIYEYDPLERLTNRWTPAKGNTVYSYDPLGNLTNVDYSLGTVYTPSINYTYDGLNRLISMADGIGTTTFGWTDGNQLQSEAGPWADDAVSYSYSDRLRTSATLSQQRAPAWTQGYGYDSVMRLSTITSPAGGSISTPSGTFTYSYTAGGNLIQQLQYPGIGSQSGPYIQNYYDTLGRLTNTYLNSSCSGIFDQHFYGYDLGSEVTQQVFTVGNFMNYTYDNIGQLKTARGEAASGGAIALEQFGYGYDKAWNLNYRTNNTMIENFSVNNLNELSGAGQSGKITVAGTTTEPGSDVTSVSVNGNPATEYADGTFAATNLTPSYGQNTYAATATDTYGRQSSSSVTVNVLGSASYSYDLNGNLTSDGVRNFIFDDENELIAVWTTNGWSNSFAYDGLQRRRIEQDYSWSSGNSSWQLTNEVLFVYDGNLVFQERDQNDMTLTTYTRGNDLSGTLQGAGGIGGLLARSDKMQIIPLILSPQNPDPQYVNTAYYHSDANGNVTALVQPSGYPVGIYQYDPYGNILGIGGLLADINKYRFSTKEWNDSAGLYYYGYRFYDPNLQRWVNRDPFGEMGSINLYGFVENDPLNISDTFGECWKDIWRNPGKFFGDILKKLAGVDNQPPPDPNSNLALREDAGVGVGNFGTDPETGKPITGGDLVANLGGEVIAGVATAVTGGLGDAGKAESLGTDAAKAKRTFSATDRAAGLEKAKDASGVPRCQYCGTELSPKAGLPNSYQADHTIPYSQGGPSTADNLTPSCRTCNLSKGAQTPDEWGGP